MKVRNLSLTHTKNFAILFITLLMLSIAFLPLPAKAESASIWTDETNTASATFTDSGWTLSVSVSPTTVIVPPEMGITRTQGFWATHYTYTWSVWSGIEDKAIGSKVIDDEGKLFGAFWSSISKTSTGADRSLLDQARMQLLQQLVAAMLNVQAFGDDSEGTGASLIAAGKAAFSGNDRTAILSIAYQLDLFNNRGNNQPLPPGVVPGPADPRGAQKIADKVFWDSLP